MIFKIALTGLGLFLILKANAQSKCLNRLSEKKFHTITESYAPAYRYDDSTLDMVFKGRMEELQASWKTLFMDMKQFLMQKGYTFNETETLWCRLYFNKDGGIDYYSYALNPQSNRKKIGRLLQTFFTSYHFQVTADRSFSQCGSFILGKK